MERLAENWRKPPMRLFSGAPPENEEPLSIALGGSRYREGSLLGEVQRNQLMLKCRMEMPAA